jgi:DnaK suppressor protein
MMTLNQEQCEHYRRRLLDLRRRISGSVDHVVDAIHDESIAAANLSNVPVHLADVAQGGLFSDVQVLDNESNLLLNIDAALTRLHEGSFGTCESCGIDIPTERLEALPFAATCTRCAAADENQWPHKPR